MSLLAFAAIAPSSVPLALSPPAPPKNGSPWIVMPAVLTVAPPGTEPGSIWTTSPALVALTADWRFVKVVTPFPP